MKILHPTDFYFLSVGGAKEVARQISERLAHKRHREKSLKEAIVKGIIL